MATVNRLPGTKMQSSLCCLIATFWSEWKGKQKINNALGGKLVTMWPFLSQTQTPTRPPCGTSSTSSVLPAVGISIQEFRPTAYLTVGDARRRGGDRDDEGARGRRQQQLVRRLGRPRRGRAGGARGRHAREVSEQVRGEEKRPRTEWAHKGVFIVQPYMGFPNIFTCPSRPVRPIVAHHSRASSGEISAVQPRARGSPRPTISTQP